MEFFRFLKIESNSTGMKVAVLAVFSGIVNGVLISVIISAAGKAATAGLQVQKLALFLLLLVGYIYSKNFVLAQTSRLTETIITQIRLRIIAKIRQADLLAYENLGTTPILAALTQDTFAISESAMLIASACSSAVMLIVATGYIAILSTSAFLVTLACIGAGVFYYYSNRQAIDRDLRRSTEKEHGFLNLLNHLLFGFKEVKMHQGRNEDLYENHLVASALEARNVKIDVGQEFVKLSIFSQVFFYILIATLVFVLPTLGPKSAGSTVQVASVILFIMGPLMDLVGSAPAILRANVAVVNIRRLEDQLDQIAPVPDPGLSLKTRVAAFAEIDLDGLAFSYQSPDHHESFTVGPINLRIRPAEILFLVGGNGSGKSTLLKLLTGLYTPEKGEIRLDGNVVGTGNLSRYRALFSTVFTDFHLFDQLYGLRGLADEQVSDELSRMQIHDKTSVVAGRFSSINLSTGQRKRVALAVALLEQRPICVFDEVAADQDPAFRRYIYQKLFPALRDQGKTIIAVTHDDAYFKTADRVMKMEYGKLIG